MDYAKVIVEREGLSSLQESIGIGRRIMKRKLVAYQKNREIRTN